MGSCYVAHTGLELAGILLPQSPEHQDYRGMNHEDRQQSWVYELHGANAGR